jgi:hypothetical protein
MPRDRSCGSYGPGHLTHWIPGKKSHADGHLITKVKRCARSFSPGPMKKDPRLGDDLEFRRHAARWRHLDGQLRRGEEAPRRAEKVERDLRTAVPPPPSPSLSLAPRYAAGRPRRRIALS